MDQSKGYKIRINITLKITRMNCKTFNNIFIRSGVGSTKFRSTIFNKH